MEPWMIQYLFCCGSVVRIDLEKRRDQVDGGS